MNLSKFIAAFEAGSGLSVSYMGYAFALLGFVGVVGGIAWAVLQQATDVKDARLRLWEAYGRAFAGLLVMAFCVAMFATGSPLAPN